MCEFCVQGAIQGGYLSIGKCKGTWNPANFPTKHAKTGTEVRAALPSLGLLEGLDLDLERPHLKVSAVKQAWKPDIRPSFMAWMRELPPTERELVSVARDSQAKRHRPPAQGPSAQSNESSAAQTQSLYMMPNMLDDLSVRNPGIQEEVRVAFGSPRVPYVLREAADLAERSPAQGGAGSVSSASSFSERRLTKSEPARSPRQATPEQETASAPTDTAVAPASSAALPAEVALVQEEASQELLSDTPGAARPQQSVQAAVEGFAEVPLEDTDATPASPAPPAQSSQPMSASMQAWANLNEVPTEESFVQVQQINEEDL